MALELTYASDATLLLDDLVDSLGSPGNAAGVVVPVLMPSLPRYAPSRTRWSRKPGDDTLILQRVTGPGTLFVHAAGDFAAFTLGQGEVLRADTDSLVWFDASVSYSAAWAGGVKRAFLGGEGLFLSTFTGPGRVTLQTMGHAPASGPGKTEKG